MCVTNDSELYERLLTLSNHGRSRRQDKQFWPDVLGFKYKMSNLQAAVGCAQFERVSTLVARKQQIFSYYQESLSDLPITMNAQPEGTTNGYWMPTIMVDQGVPFDRETLLLDLKSSDVDARIFFWPLSTLPMFQRQPQNVLSYQLAERGVNLPSYHDLTEAEMDRVVEIVRQRF